MPDFLDTLAEDRVIAVIRAPEIPDAAALATALVQGGIPWIEFTYTTPDLPTHLRHAASVSGCRIGAGTVLTAAQAEAAIEAGATYLVTPGCREEVAEVATASQVPLIMGAFTPTEVARALDLGATAIKIFPAHSLGPRYFKDLNGPYPAAPLIASGGINPTNAAHFLTSGAHAVCAGSDVVPANTVATADWPEITRRAKGFVAALGNPISLPSLR
ncbi:bifunctional 4-hydroxy-2-oxoglutarate aldolase/2-dehydro-3-deoxy-phosphogluconate aldolase [Streptomyces acidiscabies]|uniref:2-dehydro-3-deoxyphosphogluconate aldolase n=1 Tax=Streptomyces acidiscabies TaxID=42234 RepID=A0A0L0JKL1_9ACTN|nr:bifunctional 4-hydroxy-2-oxoglutarate aldolase/2-dehydro-3-deoxy-phosphogluconate aldolase [Streptomyces acidiscabies]KND26138.1 2-dehydro-3-deoxyphosphogluconate aldolase [Streptomyces acidiscabies]